MDGWTAIVMGAGKGERMRSALPKVLHPVAGVPMISHTVRSVKRIDPAPLIVVTSPDARDAIADALGDDVEFVEQPDPLGTGNALAVAIDQVPFATRQVLLTNGDLPLIGEGTIARLVALHLERSAALTLVTATLPAAEAADFGRLQRGARGKPIAIVEARETTATETSTIDVNVGMYALDMGWLRGALSDLPHRESGEYYVTDLVAMAVADGQRIESLSVDAVDEAIGVNTRRHLAHAEQAMQTRLRNAAMDAGVTLIDPATVYLDATVELAEDVTVHPNTAIRGTTRIGFGSSVGPNAQVIDCTVGDRCTIGSAVLVSAVLEQDVHVGHYSHVRPASYLESGAFVGTHAEIKAARIGRDAHVGHFSYVGDAVVGARANIGAGAVTCNYDGTSKHVTVIGDDAFIGSDSLLVAPVEIGAGAVTGAGSVVIHDVPPGDRVIGVPARPMSPVAPRRSRGDRGDR